MKLTSITYNTTSRNIFNTNSKCEPSFRAYIYDPQGTKKKKFADLNPIKQQLDKVIETSMKAARRRVRPVDVELAPFTTTVDIKVRPNSQHTYGWDINPDDRQKYVLFLYGTGQNISNLQSLYKAVINNTNYAVFTPEYRGFGRTIEQPISSRSFFEDAIAAMRYLREKGVRPSDVTIVGHSLGCQVATQVACRKSNQALDRLVLMSPIDNFSESMKIEDSLKNSVPKPVLLIYKTARFLNRDFDDFYGVGRIIGKVNAPVDIIHAKNDRLVSYHSADEVSKKVKNLSSIHILDKGEHRIDQSKIDVLVDVLKHAGKK